MRFWRSKEKREDAEVKEFITKLHKIYKLEKGKDYIVSIGSIKPLILPTQSHVSKVREVLGEAFPGVNFVVAGPDLNIKVRSNKRRKRK